MGVVIKVENLSKQYRLGNVGTGSLKDDFKRFRYRLMGKEDPFLKIGEENDRTKKSGSDYVWALRDINFEVQQGDVVGIIGRNGAGKSTLLKILSRTTAPTTGSVKVKGRIASLLEVGTGFHGELSGRENIYLNGAIMGLRKWEIDKKLDEIIDFAGVEKYLDTPVKRYSSGMYVRLAFAVAAHLEPDILIVDEVLAVGDAEFQKKCLGKMKEVSEGQGRTILFVSHNMDAIKALCEKGIFLQNGFLTSCGNIKNQINAYLMKEVIGLGFSYNFQNDDIKKAFISNAAISINGNMINAYSNGDQFKIEMEVESNIDIVYSLELLIKDISHNPILFSPIGLINNYNVSSLKSETKKYTLSVNLPYLASGRYFIDLMVVDSGKQFYDYVENALFFDVLSNYMKETAWNFSQVRGQGSILLKDISIIQRFDD